MASDLEYVQFVCEQMSGAGEIVYKKMFGDYGIYCNGKIFGLICDNQVFLKPTNAGKSLMPSAQEAPPYTGAKPYLVLEELDDRAFLTELITRSCAELPMPKPKKRKQGNL